MTRASRAEIVGTKGVTSEPWPSISGAGRADHLSLLVLVLFCIATFVEGLDTASISYVAPYMQEEMHLTPIMLGSIFSASTAGMFFGGLAIAPLGDAFGRRPVIVACAIPFGALTLATSFASTFEQVLVLRFLSGIVLGGIPPLVFALVIESAPQTSQSSYVGTIMAAYALGAFIAGVLTAFVARSAGWSAVFMISGIATLAEATALALFLPESPLHLATRHTAANVPSAMSGGSTISSCRSKPVATIKRLFGRRSPVAGLFYGNLKTITPLLWLCSGASALALHFKANWTPMIYETLSIDRGTAAIVASLSNLAGAAAGLLLTRVADQRGSIWIATLPMVSAPVLLVAGVADISQSAFLVVTFLGSLLVTTVHFGVLSIIGLSYPTTIRGFAIGCVLGIAKIGGVAGPVIGGYLLATGLPIRSSYSFLAFGAVIIGLSLILITRMDTPTSALSARQDRN